MKTLLRNIKFTVRYAFGPFMLCFTLHCFHGLLPVGATYLWKLLLERIEIWIKSSHGIETELIPLVILYSIVYGISVALPSAFEVIDTMLRNKIKKIAQYKIHEKVSKLSLKEFDNPEFNDYISNASDTMVNGVFMYVSLNFTYFIGRSLTIVSTTILLLSYSPLLSLNLIVLFLPIWGNMKINEKKTRLRFSQATLKRNIDCYTDYIINATYAKETRLLNCGDYFLSKRKEYINQMKDAEMKLGKLSFGYQMITYTTKAVSYGLSIILGLYLMKNGKLTVAELAAMISIVGTVYYAYQRLLDDIVQFPSNIAEIENGFKLLDIKEEKREQNLPSLKNEISMKNVSFRYPLSERDVLSNINLKIKENEVIAIVGENGAGKSTLVKLLTGLYPATTGEVLYDETDISQVKFEELYKDTSAVFEDFNKYALSLQDNITLEENVDMIRFQDAINQTGLDSIINKHEDGPTLFLGKEFGGTELSGGEWQKVALARGYYKNSKFIILDEPTAALDAMAEYDVYEKFKQLCDNKFGIIVTHRLSAATLANRIIYLKDGKIKEEGTHEELININGEYAKMYNIQKNLYVS